MDQIPPSSDRSAPQVQLALLRAAVDGDAEKTSALLNAGADPAWGNPMGQTALHMAALWGNKDVCTALIKGKANLNQTNRHGCTPLHTAASGRGDSEKRAEAIGVLLQAGARRSAQDAGGRTPIDCAEDEDVRIALGGQELHVHKATQLKQLKALDEALRNHPDNINAVNGRGETALYLAVSSSWHDGAKRLLQQKADPNLAAFRDKSTPLLVAAKFGNIGALKELLVAKANPDAQDIDLELDPDTVSNISTTRDEHCSALHYASRAGNPAVADLLLQHKACVNVGDSHQCTPLHYSLEQILNADDPDIEIGSGVRLQGLQATKVWNGLIASVFGEKSKEGRWPVQVQSRNEEALIKTQNLTGPLYEETLNALLEGKADPCVGNHKVGMDRGFLHTAALSGRDALISKAIGAGCQVNALYKGSTALHLLARNHRDPKAFRALIDAKADVNVKSSPGESTALDIATKNRAPAEIIRLLGGEVTYQAAGYPSPTGTVSTIVDISPEQRAALFLD